MFCENCGAKIEDGAMFCQECGAKVSVDESAGGQVQPESVTPVSAPAQDKASTETYAAQSSTATQSQGNPDQGYADPNAGYANPDQGYADPNAGYGNSNQGYADPNAGYGNPNRGYGNPNQGYNNYGNVPPKPEKKKTSPCLIIFLVLLGIGLVSGIILIILVVVLGAKAKEYFDKTIAPELGIESEYDDYDDHDDDYGDYGFADEDDIDGEREDDEWEDESGDGEDWGDYEYGEPDENGYSDDELCEMALDFYEAIYEYRPDYASVESEDEDGVTIGLFDENDDKRTGIAYYCVGRDTARGYDVVFGNEIDLLDPLAADYSFDNYGDQGYDEGLNEYLCSWSDFSIINENNWFDLEQDIKDRRGQMPGDRTIAQMIINEIYARHGYIFKDKDLNNYFSVYSWYEGDTKDMKVIESRLNDYETKNIKFLQKVNK